MTISCSIFAYVTLWIRKTLNSFILFFPGHIFACLDYTLKDLICFCLKNYPHLRVIFRKIISHKETLGCPSVRKESMQAFRASAVSGSHGSMGSSLTAGPVVVPTPDPPPLRSLHSFWSRFAWGLDYPRSTGWWPHRAVSVHSYRVILMLNSLNIKLLHGRRRRDEHNVSEPGLVVRHT